MAIKKKKGPAKEKKRKKWVTVMAPQEFGNISLGEVYVEEAEHSKNKTIKLNLASVSSEMRRQNVSLRFVIDSIQGSQAQTKVVGYELPAAFVKRAAKKGKSKVDDSVEYPIKDGKVRIKTVVILRGKAPNSVQTAVRLKSREEIAKRVSEVDLVKLFQMVTRMEIQKQLKAELNKNLSVQNFTIRKVEIVK
jgi:small subunit ribosomal protein S3Ae